MHFNSIVGASRIELPGSKQTEINLIRGAVTKGNLIVNESINTLLGPAVNETYILESQIAIYPRIVISDKLIDCELKSYFKEDSDGTYFFDFLLFLQKRKAYVMSQEEMNRHITFLEGYIKNSGNLKINQKYKWFKKYLYTRNEDRDK